MLIIIFWFWCSGFDFIWFSVLSWLKLVFMMWGFSFVDRIEFNFVLVKE